MTRKKKRPIVSVITPMYNRLEYTVQCIDAVKRCNAHFPYEHILIDNGSWDGTREWFNSLVTGGDWWNNQTVLHLDKNIGDHAAKAKGLDIAKGRYILMLDNDMKMIEPQFLDKMCGIYDLLAQDQECGVLGAKREGMRCVIKTQEEWAVTFDNETYDVGPVWYVPMPFYRRDIITHTLINGWPANLPAGKGVWKVFNLRMIHMDGGTQKEEGYNWGDQKHKYPEYFDSKVHTENEYGKDMISQWEA